MLTEQHYNKGEYTPLSMGRKPLKNRTVSVSISLHPDILKKLDNLPGSRSKNIQRILKDTLPQDYDVSIMGYFYNAIHGQNGQSTIMDSLKRTSVEKHLRAEWNISKRQDLWNVVPSEVRDWCYAFIFPLESIIRNISTKELKLLMGIAKKQLDKMLEE